MTRRQYSGGANTASLAAGISGVDTTISCTTLTNWPDGTVGPFFIVIDRGKASEEKILCSSRSTNTLTVASGGRGADGTSATSHSAGAVIEHVFTATDADEANYHVNTASSTTAIPIHGLVDGSEVVGTDDTQTLTNKSLTSPTLTGTPVAPTAALDTNTTQIATTQFVLNQAADSNPVALGTAAPGTDESYSRADHVHPTTGLGLTSGTLAQFAATTSTQLRTVISDETGTGGLVFATGPTISNITLTGTTQAPTPSAGDNDQSIATTAFVNTAIAGTNVNDLHGIQRGTVTITVPAGDTFATTTINFSPSFSSAPTIIAVTQGGSSLSAAAGFNAYVNSVASGGGSAVVGVRRVDSGTSGSPQSIVVAWIAIGPGA